MPPVVSPPSRAWTLDWATASVLLSVAGAGLSLVEAQLFVVGALLFVAGLVVGIVALRKGVRRNWAIVGVVLNTVNLLYDVAIQILSKPA